jgi:hypothetical protein
MSTPMELLMNQIADAVARRVIELQKAEAAMKHVDYLRPAQMATRMGVTEKTLANLRSAKKGPKFVKVGGTIRYPVDGTADQSPRAG